MSNYSVCFSPTGGTKKVTDILGNALAPDWQEIDLCREVAPMNLTAEDVCLVSVPSYGGRVPGVALDRLAAIKANGAKAVLVCVYGNREWEDTLTELQDTLERCGFVCAAAVAAVQSTLSSASTPQTVPMQMTQQSLTGLPNRSERSWTPGNWVICTLRETTVLTRNMAAFPSSRRGTRSA